MEVPVKATLKESISKKGSTYMYVSLMITPTCEKKIFLEPSEVELLKIQHNKDNIK